MYLCDSRYAIDEMFVGLCGICLKTTPIWFPMIRIGLLQSLFVVPFAYSGSRARCHSHVLKGNWKGLKFRILYVIYTFYVSLRYVICIMYLCAMWPVLCYCDVKPIKTKSFSQKLSICNNNFHVLFTKMPKLTIFIASYFCTKMYRVLQGVLAAAPLAFIIPPLCVMKLRQEPIFSKDNIIPILITSFGSIVAVVGFIMAIVNFSKGYQCSHGAEPDFCIPNERLLTNSSFSSLFSTTSTTPQVT